MQLASVKMSFSKHHSGRRGRSTSAVVMTAWALDEGIWEISVQPEAGSAETTELDQFRTFVS
jgi:hypothetical protein